MTPAGELAQFLSLLFRFPTETLDQLAKGAEGLEKQCLPYQGRLLGREQGGGREWPA